MDPETRRRQLEEGLSRTLARTDFEGPAPSGLGRKIEGKVRDNYVRGDGTRVLITTDRISAFDRVLGTLPFKGQVLNELAAWWFERTSDIARNHVLSVPDPNVTIGREHTPLPVEMVVRAYLTGVTSTSIWTHYNAGSREFCGHRLPDGMKKNEALPAPIVTPSTKADKGGHDVSVSRAQLLGMGQVSARDFDAASEIALALFARGAEIARERGLILADTKYEMGLDEQGRIAIIDEIHTPDSSRYWLAASYGERLARGDEPESFDKEYVRRWLAGTGFTGHGAIPTIPDEIRVEAARRYIEACEQIMGRTFEPNLEEPIGRIAKNLGIRYSKRTGA